MTRAKKIFLGAIVIFVLLLAYASYDIATRTSFPGSKPQLQERLQKEFLNSDSDTAVSRQTPFNKNGER